MPHSKSIDEQSQEDSDDIAQIREVILGSDYADLVALKNCLDDPVEFSHKLAPVISEAISHRVKADQSLSVALAPTINVAIQESIARDPHVIADALYPVMGPAIRRSISEALAQMLERINLLLENSLSPKSIGWRIDAWRSGRSYSEIVLLNSLEFQVEQIFLIHKETGLLLQHVMAELALSKDPDIVSSMISAIQDYIHDSFSVDENEHLKSMQLGDLTVLLEAGPYAVIAAVVRGNAPSGLNELFKKELEDLHHRSGKQLSEFSGNVDDFSALEPSLRRCLVSRNRAVAGSAEKKKPWVAITLLLIFLVVAIGVLANSRYQRYQLEAWREQAIENLEAEPGIVVIGTSIEEPDTLLIKGLRDALSSEPLQVAEANLPTQLAIEFEFQPYLSLEPNIILKRVSNVLQPPDSVDLVLNGTRLVATGTADVSWLEQLENSWRFVYGIESLDRSALSTVDPVLEELVSLRATVESAQLSFATARTELDDIEDNIPVLANVIREILDLSGPRQYNIAVLILGDTDNTGTEGLNLRIAEQRAGVAALSLIENGVPNNIIRTASLQDYPEYSDGQRRRRVLFKVTGLPEI